MRLADADTLEEALSFWFVLKRSQNMSVSGLFYVRKLHSCMQCSTKTTLNGRFRQVGAGFGAFANATEYGRFLYGERKCLLTILLQSHLKQELRELIGCEQMTLDQLYNCDQTGLCYRMLPGKTLASRSKREASAMKKMKERVILMPCSNATGIHMLPLLHGDWQVSKTPISTVLKMETKTSISSPLLFPEEFMDGL